MPLGLLDARRGQAHVGHKAQRSPPATAWGLGPGSDPGLCAHRRLQAQAAPLRTVSRGHATEQEVSEPDLTLSSSTTGGRFSDLVLAILASVRENRRCGGSRGGRREGTDGRAPNSASPAVQTPSVQEEKVSAESGRQAGHPLAAASRVISTQRSLT